jgi:hypothetical protein
MLRAKPWTRRYIRRLVWTNMNDSIWMISNSIDPLLRPNSTTSEMRKNSRERMNACATWFWSVSLRNISLRRVFEFVSTRCEMEIAKPIKRLCFGEFFLCCWNHYERKFSHKCVFARNFSHFARRGIKPLIKPSPAWLFVSVIDKWLKRRMVPVC